MMNTQPKIKPLNSNFGRLLLGFLATMAVAAGLRAEVLLQTEGTRLSFSEGRLQVERAGKLVAEVKAFEFNYTAPKSVVVTAHTADRVVLHAVYPSVAKYQDEEGDLPVDIEVTPVAGGYRFHAVPTWAFNTTIRLRDLDDHFFGILEPLYPDNRLSPDLRGEVVPVDMQGDQSQYHENYASAWSAFYMTSHGMASFYDTFAKGSYRLGINGETKLYHRTGTLDWYVFLGRDGDELLTAYYRVIGAPKAPPLWAMGPIGWRDNNLGGAPEILDDVRRMSDLRIPFTAWFVDRPYSDGAHEWSKMNFSKLFANPEEWIGRLHKDYDLKFMTWVAPMTFGDPDFPGQLPGATGYMDLTNPDVVKEYEHRLTTLQYSVGVQGHKMDRAEEYFPEMTTWKDGTADNETRNKYLYLYAKVVHEALTKAWGADYVNFPRGAFHRTQPFLTAIWGGDSRSSWDGLAGNLANSIRCGFMGFPVWGSDTGGYLGGRIEPELYARWLQWGAWNGLFEIKLDGLNGTPPDRTPWVYGVELQAAFRAACEQRMQLLPYAYSLAHTSGHTGVLMKPLAYVWPNDPATYAIWDEYLFGSAFLVAPLTAPGGHRSVYLPAGQWYDYYDLTKEFTGGKAIAVSMPFERIPVFVRANSVAVTGTIPIGNQKVWAADTKSSLVVHVFPGVTGETAAFEYVDSADQNHVKTVTVARTGDYVSITLPALSTGGEIRVRCKTAPRATQNGRDVSPKFEAGTARFAFAAGEAISLKLTAKP